MVFLRISGFVKLPSRFSDGNPSTLHDDLPGDSRTTRNEADCCCSCFFWFRSRHGRKPCFGVPVVPKHSAEPWRETKLVEADFSREKRGTSLSFWCVDTPKENWGNWSRNSWRFFGEMLGGQVGTLDFRMPKFHTSTCIQFSICFLSNL